MNRLPLTLFVISGMLSLVLSSSVHAQKNSASLQAYFQPYIHQTSAVDAKGICHQGSDYAGNPPWLDDRLKSVAPEYPYSERLHRHEGRGIIRLTLDLKTGLVTKAVVIKSTGFSTLDACAIGAFRRWTWKPRKWKEIDMPVTFVMGRSPLPPGAIPLPRS